MINDSLQIVKPSAPIMLLNSHQSELLTEGLFGETFIIKDLKKDWVYGKLETDRYVGWMHIENFGCMSEITHKIRVLRTVVLSEPNIKSPLIFYLPLGALVSAIPFDENWLQINFLFGKMKQCGFVYKKHTLNIKDKILDWVDIAEQLIGVPYKWGGRNTIGLDCSALVQICLSIAKIKFPRDTKDQIIFEAEEIKKIEDIKRGNLIFWDGHVAIAQDTNYLVHANAYHMQVKSEKISVAIDRLEETVGKFSKIKVIPNDA